MKILNYKSIILCVFMLLSVSLLSQQKSISITIDDVPKTTKYQRDNFKPLLLNMLDSLEVPFTIFINEDKINNTKWTNKNKDLLEMWIKSKYAIIGNHTYSHSRYSKVGFDYFVTDIKNGDSLTNQYAAKYNKALKYFRFPFNDLGKDSTQHTQIRKYLQSNNYVIAPFSVESSDWMFNAVYQYYLNIGDIKKAKSIGEQYVDKTIELVFFYEMMGDSIYKRPIPQIYLCHDNAINADYLSDIITRLKQADYKIVSFEESLIDSIYKQKDNYYEKWGISWLYRYMESQEERIMWMKKEPNLTLIQSEYERLFGH